MPRPFRRSIFAVPLLVALFAPSAQAETTDRRQGRELFDAGVRAARREDWAEAEAAFTQASAIHPSPLVLGSLAGVQAKRGHVVVAVETYRRALAAPGDLSPSEAEAFRVARAAVQARVARVRVVLLSTRPGDRVLLDDRVVGEGLVLALDPGAHFVRLVRRESDVARSSFTLRDGEERDIVLAAAADPTPPPERPRERAPSSSIFASPWFWTGVGVAVAGAAATVCVTSVCRADEPYSGNLGRVNVR